MLFTPALRHKTEVTAARLHELIASGKTPPPVLKPQCDGCSLRDICLPEALENPDRVREYVAQLFRPDRPEDCLRVARSIVAAKIQNCRTNVLRGARESDSPEEADTLKKAADRMACSLDTLARADSVDSARGCEGDAARVYFDSFNLLVRKRDEVTHPVLDEKVTVGLLAHVQARLLARFLRCDIDDYPALVLK